MKDFRWVLAVIIISCVASVGCVGSSSVDDDSDNNSNITLLYHDDNVIKFGVNVITFSDDPTRRCVVIKSSSNGALAVDCFEVEQ